MFRNMVQKQKTESLQILGKTKNSKLHDEVWKLGKFVLEVLFCMFLRFWIDAVFGDYVFQVFVQGLERFTLRRLGFQFM